MRSRSLRRTLALVTIAIPMSAAILSWHAGSTLAQEGEGKPRQGGADPRFQGPTDPGELTAFLDDLFAQHMEQYNIAGAAVAVVKDGQLLVARGYGYADLANQIPVDPERTLFKIGSVTKLFTWTAVMQLVEKGKIDLKADIIRILIFGFQKPIRRRSPSST